MKAININGGLGRVVASLPALYASNSLIITNGWEELFSMTNLKTIEAGSSYIGEAIRDLDVVTPEPYHQAGYRRGEYNMVEAFHRDLGTQGTAYGLFPCPTTTARLHKQVHEAAKGLPLAMVQVKASGERNLRDLNEDTTKNAIQALRDAGYFPVVIGDTNLGFDLEVYNINNTSITEFVSLIMIGDIFVGGDSSGMHIAKALNKKGIIIFTSTGGTKYYPENFVEFRHPTYENTVEYPRLFRAELLQNNHNTHKGVDQYFVTTEQFADAIQLVRG